GMHAGGMDLAPGRAGFVRRMADGDPGAWDPDMLAEIRGSMRSDAAGIPLRLIYGSEHPYREVDGLLPREGHGVGLLPSLGRGGFSTVWGAAVLPYLAEELAGWPIWYADLVPHYRAVLSFMGLAAAK